MFTLYLQADSKSSPPWIRYSRYPDGFGTLRYSKVFLSAAEKFIIYGLANFRPSLSLSPVRRRTSWIGTKGGQKKVSITIYIRLLYRTFIGEFFSAANSYEKCGTREKEKERGGEEEEERDRVVFLPFHVSLYFSPLMFTRQNRA